MGKKLKVSIIGTNGLPAKYGGFETLTHFLSNKLNKEFDFLVYCSKTVKEKRVDRLNNSRLKYLPLSANGWQSMIYDAISIMHSYFFMDVLVILGFSGVFAFPFKSLFRKKIVFNLGGIEWQKVRGKKFTAKIEVLVKKWFEKITIRFSDVIIVDNQVLWDYVKKTYGIDCVLAEYGGDHAVKVKLNENLIRKYPYLSSQYDVTVSRAQEDMNIHVVLEAYKQLPERTLVAVSNWEISVYGQQLKNAYKDKYPNIIIQDAVYDIEEINAIRSNASIYFHTHSLCGTAPSLVEAMSLGLPVICFDVPTNHSATEEKSVYFSDAPSLLGKLKNLDIIKLEKLGADMREIAQRRYTWERITFIYRKCINN
jgi:glycosyltransferase involved in cell wall biosynthesis